MKLWIDFDRRPHVSQWQWQLCTLRTDSSTALTTRPFAVFAIKPLHRLILPFLPRINSFPRVFRHKLISPFRPRSNIFSPSSRIQHPKQKQPTQKNKLDRWSLPQRHYRNMNTPRRRRARRSRRHNMQPTATPSTQWRALSLAVSSHVTPHSAASTFKKRSRTTRLGEAQATTLSCLACESVRVWPSLGARYYR
jgi:hypothetical protein